MKLPEGYTIFIYAKAGAFFQLLAVCLINLAICAGMSGAFQGEQGAEGHSLCFPLYLYGGFSAPSYDSVPQVASLPFLRIIVLWALAVTAFVLAGIIVTIFRPDSRLFRYCMMVVTVFYLVLAFAKPDYWIAGYNIQYVNLEGNAAEQAENSYRDFNYTAIFSPDAAVLASRRVLPDGKFHGHAELFQ